MSTPIEVHIDELTLHGLDPRSSSAFVDALRGELVDALTGWQPAAPGSHETIDLGAIGVARGAAPASLGRSVGARIARAVRDSDETGAVRDSDETGAVRDSDETRRVTL